MRYPELNISSPVKVDSPANESDFSHVQGDTSTELEPLASQTKSPVNPVLSHTPTSQKNNYIIQPMINFLDCVIEKVSIIRDGQDLQSDNYRKFLEIIGKICNAVEDLKNKVNDETILDSTLVVDTISEVIQTLNKQPQLKRMLKNLSPPMDFEKEYKESVQSVGAHYEKSINSVKNIVKVSSLSMFKSDKSEKNEYTAATQSDFNPKN